MKMLFTVTCLCTVSAMLSNDKPSLDDSLKKYEKKYEEEYSQDLQDREMAAEQEPAGHGSDSEHAKLAAGGEHEVHESEGEDVDSPPDANSPPSENVPDAPENVPDAPADAPNDEGVSVESAAPKDYVPEAPADAPDDLGHAPAAQAMAASPMDQALEKLKSSAKMMVVLHVLMKPIGTKLRLAMDKMGDVDKAKAEEIISHLDSLDDLSQKAVLLLGHVEKAKHGTPEEQERALSALVFGMKQIQSGVKTHLLAMKNPIPEQMMHAEHSPLAKGKLGALTDKLHTQLASMQAKVDKELADPAKKDDPIVQMDVLVLNTMKKSVKKAESLVMVAAVAMKKTTTVEQKAEIKKAIKIELQNVMIDLKKNLNKYKDQTVILMAMDKIKRQGGVHGAMEHSRLGKLREAAAAAEMDAGVPLHAEDVDAAPAEASADTPKIKDDAPETSAEAPAESKESTDDAPKEEKAETTDGFEKRLEEDTEKYQEGEAAGQEQLAEEEAMAMEPAKKEPKDPAVQETEADHSKFSGLLDQLDELKHSFTKPGENLRKN